MTSAPPAMPLMTAIQPVWRPITSTTMTRLCDSAVVCSRSIASVAIEDGGVEPEGVVGGGEVVVDRLRDADDGKVALRVEPGCDAERVLASDRDERVDALTLEVREQSVEIALASLKGFVRDVPMIVPAARQDPGDLARAERLELTLDEPAPACADRRRHPSRGSSERLVDRPDDGVQARAVATARQDADAAAPRS